MINEIIIIKKNCSETTPECMRIIIIIIIDTVIFVVD